MAEPFNTLRVIARSYTLDLEYLRAPHSNFDRLAVLARRECARFLLAYGWQKQAIFRYFGKESYSIFRRGGFKRVQATP